LRNSIILLEKENKIKIRGTIKDTTTEGQYPKCFIPANPIMKDKINITMVVNPNVSFNVLPSLIRVR